MRRIFTLLLLCWAGITFGQHDDLKFEIERIILNDTEISLDDTPGFIITIIDGEETYYVDFGSDGTPDEVGLSSEDIFETGSISKVFTASLVSVLEANGLISYDDKVNYFLAEEFQNPRLDSITVLDLIQHYSTLPIRPSFFGKRNINPEDPYGFYTKNDLLSFYAKYVPEQDRKDQFRYAHTNYGLLEIILENATGMEYGSLLSKYIFEPLAMKSAFVDFPENTENILANGYDRATREASPWTFQSFAASEGVKASSEDLERFVRANLEISSTRLDSIFKMNTYAQKPTDFNEVIFTGKGWQILDRAKRYNIVTHTGKTGGHNAFIAFITETKTGVVILSNSTTGTENLGFLILRMINNNWKRKAK